MKTARHPSGKLITFHERPHYYCDESGVKYTSVSQILKKFVPKFDAVEISKKCSLGNNPKYAGRPPAEIQAEWKAEGFRATTEGDNLHRYIEAILIGTQPPKPISDRCGKLFHQADRAIEKLLKRFELMEVEKIVFSPELKIAGMVDLLLFDKNKNQIVLADWKQSKEIKIKNEYGSCLLFPVDHLQQTELSQYSLQLSMYQFLLENGKYYPGYDGFRRAILHIGEGFHKAIPVEYYQYEIQEILKNGF